MSMPKILTYKHYDPLDNYPVGSIYMSLDPTNPSSLFGGIWEQIKDTFLLATGDKYLENTTGGADSHIHSTQGHALTVAEMPSHYHLTYVDQGFSAHPTGNTNSWKQALVNAGNHAVTHGYYDQPAGGNASHTHGDTSSVSNLPPYMTVYVWKRIQ